MPGADAQRLGWVRASCSEVQTDVAALRPGRLGVLGVVAGS